MKKYLHAIRVWSAAHKLAASAIVAVVIVGGIGMYRSATTAHAATQYVLSPVTTGNIVQTVTGSGQVSAANQLDVTPQVSGQITSIVVSVGQHVSQGDLLATIDDTSALNSLNNAKLSLAQLTESAKPGDIADAANALSTSYSDGFGNVASAFTDLQTVMTGLNDMFYTQGGFLSDQKSSLLTPTAQGYLETAGQDYDKANAEYTTMLTEYKSLNRQSATSSIAQLISDTYTLTKDVSTVLQDTQTTTTWIAANEPSYSSSASLSTAESSVTSWSNSVNSDISSLAQAQNTTANDQNTLNNLVTGADPLAVQASELSVQQAQQTYDNYFIRAPFSGTIGRIPASVYSQASGSTVIATVVGDQKLAIISLDEVDAAKVKVGQPATITFDAISGFTATGTVSEVDQVGTVVSGVVSFGVKIAIATDDPRILPGMSLNTTIVTNEIDGVTIVPSAAVKTQSGRSYVQVFPAATVRAYIQSMAAASGRAASSTRSFGGAAGTFGSSTPGFASSTTAGAGFDSTTGAGAASSTRSFARSSAGGTGSGRASLTVTMPSATLPQTQAVTVGQSDATNVQIMSGLTAGEWIVTRTIAGSTASAATAAPSLLSSLSGGARTGAAGAGGATFRATGAGGGAAQPPPATRAGG